MSDIFPLYRLQQLDIQMDQARARQQKIDAILSNDSAVKKAEEAERLAKEELLTAQRKMKKLEGDVEGIKGKITSNNASLYGGNVRNPKELQDLQQESLALQRHLASLEEELLNAMITAEEAENIHASSARALEEAQSQAVQKNSLLRGEYGTLNDTINRLSIERDTMTPTLDPEVISHYETLRKKKGGIAVSRIENNTCSSCGARLNASLIHLTRTESSLNHCDGCGRILYAG